MQSPMKFKGHLRPVWGTLCLKYQLGNFWDFFSIRQLQWGIASAIEDGCLSIFDSSSTVNLALKDCSREWRGNLAGSRSEYLRGPATPFSLIFFPYPRFSRPCCSRPGCAHSLVHFHPANSTPSTSDRCTAGQPEIANRSLSPAPSRL